MLARFNARSHATNLNNPNQWAFTLDGLRPLPMLITNMDQPKNKSEIIPSNGKNHKLTVKQQRFVEEYCTDWNATQAAIRAGYSPHTAQEISSENLSKPMIKDAIDAHRAVLTQKCGITSAELTKRIDELFTKTGKDEKKKGWNPHVAAKLLEMHGKHIGHFEADNAQKDHGVQVLIQQYAGNASNVGELAPPSASVQVHSDSQSPCVECSQGVIEGETVPTDGEEDQ